MLTTQGSHRILVAFLVASVLFGAACNRQPHLTDTKNTMVSTTSYDDQKNKTDSEVFLLGKDLNQPGMATSNTLYLTDGKGSLSVETGMDVWISKLYIIDYQNDVEYAWASENSAITQASKGMIRGIAPGVTHVKCVTRSKEVIADLTVTVKTSQASRVEKATALPGGVYYGALTIKDKFFYVGNSVGIQKVQPDQNYFYKLDMALNIVWKYDLGRLGTRGAAVVDSQGNIYFTAEDVKTAAGSNDSNAEGTLGGKDNIALHVSVFLYSLNSNGQLRFRQEITGKGGMYHIGMLNCAIDRSDTLYIADYGVTAYDTTGNTKWTFVPATNMNPSAIATRSSPIFDDKGNFFVLMGDKLYRFDAGSKGIPAWETQLETTGSWMSLSTPSFNYDFSRIYVPVYETVFCVDSSKGNKVWQVTPEGIKGEFRANAAVDANGNVYIGTKADRDSTLYAVKADGSGVMWHLLVGGDLYCSPVLGDDGMLYLGSEPSILGAFYAIKPITGEVVWSLSEGTNGYGGIGWGSLRILDGYIYCAGENIFKIKVDARNYLQGAGWPTFRGSNDDSGNR